MSTTGKKPQYEKPELIDLNEPPIQAGGACSHGTHVSTNICFSGTYAGSFCINGTAPRNSCQKGSGAAACGTGTNATTACTPGSHP